ncbi:replication initiation factor domain-containing protein [Morganella morganii subsp. morganii]|uniref:replication initiation factor domain-containing protein n=1 Tax=Morganella morganii TaxID=582 RepID=UPI001BDB0D61|nr:replication initiation factor domain-containing protein [Morganella morganii]MBT0512029.1 replication initiation factor domain-containing protein [Morganella morganii subsp. morganii]
MVENSERVVFVDYLAFSAPISVMKEVHTFQEKGFEWRKFQYLPAYRYYQNSSPYIFSDGYQEVPAIAVSPLTEDQQSRYFEDLYACYFSRLKTWIASLFGLVVGAPRGKGGFAYQDSAVLYSDEGSSDRMGMLYWGGNKETFYVQISGIGCAHVFSGTTPQKIHKWFEHLDITRLKRLDLATDDYDGIYTCRAALSAYRDDAFYGGLGPKPKLEKSEAIDSDGCPTKEIVNVGSRQSRVYWRIYNKALEQKVSGIWYRSEVELKEISVDVLLNIASIYTGLCDYAAQINPSMPTSIPRLFGRKAIDSIEAKVRWLRNQASASIAKVFHFFNGDIETVLSMIIREDHITNMNLRLEIPPIYQTLLNEKLNTLQCPF